MRIEMSKENRNPQNISNIKVKQGTKTLNDASRHRFKTEKYCLTHRACGHSSKDYKQKGQGHKDEATLQKRLGWSNAYCAWSCESGITNKLSLIQYICNLIIPNYSPTININSSQCIIAKGDSGATRHYWREQDVTCLENVQDHNTTKVTQKIRRINI